MPIAAANGTDLHYVRSGHGDPLLLIQGLAATHLAWGRPFLGELEQSFDCVAFDNRGMGRSGRAELPFTVTDMTEDAIGLLDALEIERAHVLGISLGGMVAQELALARPERLRTLTIGASYCGGPNGKLPGREFAERLGAAASSGDPERMYRTMWEIMLSAEFRRDETCYAEFREMARALPSPLPVTMEQAKAGGAHDASARLGGIVTPTLVIHGTADNVFVAANGEQIAATIPARLELLEDVGHLFWWEQPQRSAALIREHALAA